MWICPQLINVLMLFRQNQRFVMSLTEWIQYSTCGLRITKHFSCYMLFVTFMIVALRPLWRLTCQAGSASEPLRKLLSSSRELFPDVLMARSSSVRSTVALSVKPFLTMTPLARTSSFLSFASIIVTIVSYNCSQKLSPYTGRYFFNHSVFTVTSLHMTTAVSPSHDHHGTSTQVHSTSSAAVIQMISQNQYRREGR